MAQRKIDVVLDSVKRLIRIGATANLVNLLHKQHPADLAQVFSDLGEKDRHAAFSLLVERNSKLAMEALSELGPEGGAALLADRSPEEIAGLLHDLPSDDAAAIIDNLPEPLSAAVLELIEKRPGDEVGDLLEYEEQTAGRIMNPKVFALSEDMTAGESITTLQGSRDVEMVFYLYVVDASYNLLAIPVVDEENKLVGVITVDDVIDVIKDEATEDVYRLAGVAGDDRVFSTAFESLRKRVPWLEVNLVTAFLAASVVSLFEGSIEYLPVLAVFMPVVAGMGGNAATQTLTVIVRGIALGELTWANSRKALLKEATVGIGNGLACGIVGALVVWVWKGDLVLGLILCAAMVINMFVAATAGTVIPLALRAMKVDPALASSVFITTLTDVFGFASWLGLASLFMRFLKPAG
jgi:magnesium transporter